MITFASSNKKKIIWTKSKIPTPVISLIPLFVLVALLAMVIPIFGGDALLGGSQVSLLDRFVRMCRHSHDKIQL